MGVGEYPGQGECDNVHVWDPRVNVYRHESGKLQVVTMRVCPGYVFVGSRHGWKHIEKSLGARLIRFGGKPHPVPPWELHKLAESVDRAYYLRPMFQQGQRVQVSQVARSAFAGMIGRFQREVHTDAGTFARLVVDIYGEVRRTVTVPLDYVVAW